MPQRKPTATEILINVLITLLTPMFLAVSGGDVQTARLAAYTTIHDYGARNNADLITVAKIIALGLATISALSLALMDDISLAMRARLQASATACDRAEHRNRRVLKDIHRAPPPPAPEPPEVDEADVIASAEHAAALARDARQAQAQQAHAAQSAPAQSASAQSVQDINRANWATACATVAQEYAAEMPNLPPQQRWAAAERSKALSSFATDLLNGLDLTPYRLRSSSA